MTVPVPDQLEYISDADGTTTEFPYPKRFLQSDEIVVLLRDADGVDTQQYLNQHYSIAGSAWPNGGAISFYVAPAVGVKVVRYRMTQAKQTVDLENRQRNDAPSVELQLDRLTMAIQDRGSFLTRLRDWLSSTVIALRVERVERIAGDANLNGRVDREIIDRENGDKAVASLVGQAGPIEVPFYDTRLSLSFAKVKETINLVQVGGYSQAGDMQVTSYRRVSSDPGWGERVQSADGAWWQEVKNELSKSEASANAVTEGRQEIATTWHTFPGDQRGAMYESSVSNAALYSDDLKIVKDGIPYVNRMGWRRCFGKRYGRIVVAGSSTPAGTGTTGYFPPSASNEWTESASSWVGLLRAAIGADGEVINRSVQGWNTQSFIDRFWRDIAPYAPDTVIISTGYVNEPAATPESRRAADVHARLLRLCGMCARIGAKPIVMITMAGGQTNLIRTYAIASAIRQAGITVWDISTSVKNIDANTIASDYASDSTHANDAGHMRYFQNININDLEVDIRGAVKEPFGQILGRDGYYLIADTANASDEYGPLTAIFTGYRPLDICAHVRVRGVKASGNTRGCILNLTSTPGGVTDHPEISVRATADTDEWALFADGQVILRSGVSFDKQGFTSAIVSYDRGRNRFDYYHDYTFIGSYTPSFAPATNTGWTHVRAGSSSNYWHLSGWEIHDFTVMRNPAMNGWGIKGANRSMEFSLPLPCTMGARFGLASMEASLGVVNNVELDGGCRLIVNRAYARKY